MSKKISMSEDYPQHGDISVSKTLSKILRHDAKKLGIRLSDDGYAYWDDLSKLRHFSGVGLSQIERIVSRNSKQRFKLIRDGTIVKIRANQGHTLDCVVQEKLLTKILLDDVSKYPCVVHGTTLEAWDNIKITGLSKMGRNHIHFAIGMPDDSGVISGMRSCSQVLIMIDLARLIASEIPVFISSNLVILSPGISGLGVIPIKYFKSVIDRSSGENMLINGK